MNVISNRKIHVSPGETLTVQGRAALNVAGQSGETIRFAAPNRGVFLLQAVTGAEADAISFESDRGGSWQSLLDVGLNVFEIVVEPEADEWFCANANQPPWHPVSKGDVKCPVCGMDVQHN